MNISAFITGGFNIEYKSMLNPCQITQYEGHISPFHFNKSAHLPFARLKRPYEQ